MSDNHRDRANNDLRESELPEFSAAREAPSDNYLTTVQEACQLSQSERLDLLMRYNGMSEPVVVGTVVVVNGYSRDGKPITTYWIERLQTLDGKKLKLPLYDSHRDPRVPFHTKGRIEEGELFAQRVTVVSDDSRELRENRKPFSLTDIGPAKRLAILPQDGLVTSGDGRIIIAKSIFESEKAALSKPLEQEKTRLECEMATTRAKMAEETKRLTEETESKNAFFLDLTNAIEKAVSERLRCETIVSDTTNEIDDLNKKKGNLMAAYQQMCDFARDKASPLLALDLITDEQYGIICGNRPVNPATKDMLSWQDDLGMNYGRAVSTIHAYLLHKGIIYPRWLVENFLTLLRTNDLIILSGLSGAGKTQIVRSFAEALGGVAHVIPVKPNWTGAEDLLGFFNPLQRSYVRTPFLEALLAADRDQDRLHLICLDEMNLARAEYYFADFLSALEDRSRPAEIPLYSESEASHIQSEVRMLLAALRGSGLSENSREYQPHALDEMLKSPEIMSQIRSIFGESAAESFPAFHGRVRRALSTVLDIPSKVLVPSNVRFIGAINVDQTTYGLSPKILDRAHVVRFENPLKYPKADIEADARRHIPEGSRVAPVHMIPAAFQPQRDNYPAYDENHPAAQWLLTLYKEYLASLGMDVAYRTIRQAQLYWDLLVEVGEGDKNKNEAVAKNLIVLQKVLPKFTIDGKVKAKFSKDNTLKERWEIVRDMEQSLRETAEIANMHPNMQEELHRVRMAAEANDKIFNYWA